MDASERDDWSEWAAWKIQAVCGDRDAVPVHELRTHASSMGLSRADFDSLMRWMHSEGRLDIRAISDLRNASEREIADSLGGVNETLFWISV